MKRISGRNGRKTGAIALAAPSRRLLLTLFCLLAFSFQSYVAQTHIHVPGIADPGISVLVSSHAQVSADAGTDSGHKQLPTDDTANCPLCQAVLHAGLFVSPALLVLLLPDTQAAVGPAPIIASHREGTPSHAWHSRGPPQH